MEKPKLNISQLREIRLSLERWRLHKEPMQLEKIEQGLERLLDLALEQGAYIRYLEDRVVVEALDPTP